jgi:DnaJ-class molecular chaperone
MRARCRGGIGLRGRLLGPVRVSRKLVNVAGVASTPKGGSNFKYARRWSGKDDVDLFAELFGAHSTRTRVRGSDVHYTSPLSLCGAKKRVVMAKRDIRIPAGLKDSQTLRLRGQGRPDIGGAEPGDALVEIHIKPHPEGNNIPRRCPRHPPSAGGSQCACRNRIGPRELTLAQRLNIGTILRLHDKGVSAMGRRGDQLVECMTE